jgi:hypothetical protein
MMLNPAAMVPGDRLVCDDDKSARILRTFRADNAEGTRAVVVIDPETRDEAEWHLRLDRRYPVERAGGRG